MGNGGYKTRQREAILDYLIEHKDKHVTVNNISDHLEQEGARVGVTTIYRHLDKLFEQGLVRKYTVDGSTSACFQYSNADGTCHEHYHLKCEKCGKLIHLHCDHAAEMCRHVFDEHGFSIDLYRTVFYGICKQCKEREENKEQ